MKTQVNKAIPFNKYLTKVLNIFRFIIYKLINFFVTIPKQIRNSKSLLIIRLDSIGDYVLVRNYFHVLKQNSKYKEYNITLCGNVVWKELAETLDKSIFDNFIWMNRKKFNNNIFYKYKILKNIYSRGFEVVIDTTFSREILFSDAIVHSSKALHRIGSKGAPDSYVKWKRNLLTDRYYTRLITQSSQNLFEFYRNKEFFEVVLNEKINLPKPQIDCETILIIPPTSKDFIILFPGAQEEKRKWSTEKFAFVIQTIINRTNYDVIIAGSSIDSKIAIKLCHCFNSNRVFDMTGRTTLPQLVKMISLCKVLISNETSAVHFAAAVSTPFVCISNGNHFGRFNPYPMQMDIKSKYLYPPQIEKEIDNPDKLKSKYRFESNLDIDSITPGSVYRAFEELL